MKKDQVTELLYEALETELGGVDVYKTALRCAVHDKLKKEWQEYLEQTQNHVRIVRGVFDAGASIPRPRLRAGRWCGTSGSRS